MSKQLQIADVADDEEDQDLRNLLERYIRRSEELERRESKVMKQIELMQSAVSSLQEWNRSRKASAVSSDPVRLDLKEIEEETRLIREETKRIQQEVKQKMEENRKLQEEVERRRSSLQSETSEASAAGHWTKPDRRKDEIGVGIRFMRESDPPEPLSHPGVEFFDNKLQKLRETERKLKKESEQQLEQARNKQKQQKEKLEALEWESRINQQLVDSLRKKTDKK